MTTNNDNTNSDSAHSDSTHSAPVNHVPADAESGTSTEKPRSIPAQQDHDVRERVGSSEASAERAEVIVVGGGIGGLAAATALRQKGVSVKVFERQETFGEVGAGMQIAPNCTRLLDDMGLLDEAKSLGVLPESMVMYDATDSSEITRLDLGDVQQRYGSPYMVIHRSDLHGIFLRAAQREGAELIHGQKAVRYENVEGGARVVFESGHVEEADVVIAADGLHSVARQQLSDDQPVSSSYVAYRAAVDIEQARANNVSETDVVVYVGPGCHFVQYPLRAGEMFNQVAVFESPRAKAGEDNWGTPDELDAAFEGMCEEVEKGLPLMWRDRWWRMFDRDPIMNWRDGRIALLGDAAHPPLQYMAQGAVMAIEDAWVLAQHAERQRAEDGSIDWDEALAAYNAVRPEHCRRVVETARAWGILWHQDGIKREQRNVLMRARDTYDYSFVDWIYEPTALFPDDEPAMFEPIPLASAKLEG